MDSRQGLQRSNTKGIQRPILRDTGCKKIEAFLILEQCNSRKSCKFMSQLGLDTSTGINTLLMSCLIITEKYYFILNWYNNGYFFIKIYFIYV